MKCPEPGCKQTLVPYDGPPHRFKDGTGWCEEHARQPLEAEAAEPPVEAPTEALPAPEAQETAVPAAPKTEYTTVRGNGGKK